MVKRRVIVAAATAAMLLIGAGIFEVTHRQPEPVTHCVGYPDFLTQQQVEDYWRANCPNDPLP